MPPVPMNPSVIRPLGEGLPVLPRALAGRIVGRAIDAVRRDVLLMKVRLFMS